MNTDRTLLSSYIDQMETLNNLIEVSIIMNVELLDDAVSEKRHFLTKIVDVAKIRRHE